MFTVGDKIVYPMHGAGIIQNLEEKDIDGQVSVYYVVNIPIGNLTVTISSKKINSLGIRYVTTKEEALVILNNFTEIPQGIPENWNKRYEYNLEKIKSGEFGKVLEVYICLYLREKAKVLSGMEKKLLSSAKQIFLSELIISQNIRKDFAENMLENFIKKFEPQNIIE